MKYCNSEGAHILPLDVLRLLSEFDCSPNHTLAHISQPFVHWLEGGPKDPQLSKSLNALKYVFKSGTPILASQIEVSLKMMLVFGF